MVNNMWVAGHVQVGRGSIKPKIKVRFQKENEEESRPIFTLAKRPKVVGRVQVEQLCLVTLSQLFVDHVGSGYQVATALNLKYALIWSGTEEEPMPQYIMSYKPLAKRSMKPSKIEKHLIKNRF